MISKKNRKQIFNEVYEELDALEKQVECLKRRQALMYSLIDTTKPHINRFILEHDLTEEQVNGIMAVLNAAEKSLTGKNPMSEIDFEKHISLYMPRTGTDTPVFPYPFIQCLLITLTGTNQFDEVCDHFRRHWNVPKQERLAG
jgi:hypothetical protein